MDKEFCLLEKPWIKVLNQKNTIKEISLLDLFAKPKKSWVVCLDDIDTEATHTTMKDLSKLVVEEIRNNVTD